MSSKYTTPANIKVIPTKYDWIIECKTTELRDNIFDFTFSRWFIWKMEKTDDGYRCRFKNQDDLNTAWDTTEYNMTYKNKKLYKWKYIGLTEN